MPENKNILFSKYIKDSLHLAKKAYSLDEVPVGAVIVDPEKNKIIAKAHNLSRKKKDPTAHAEMLVIQKACKKIGSERLTGLDMYVSLEPCPMCAQAISNARIRRLYFAASDEKSGGVINGPKIFSSSSCHHKPEVYSGMMEEEAVEILKRFFQNKRD